MAEMFDALLGQDEGGNPVGLIRLGHPGFELALTNFGARMLSIRAPDRHGRLDHVLLGFDRADMILKAGSFGAVLGRFANRIADGRFTLDGTTYRLSQNDGTSTLHGGKLAFSKKFWTLTDRDATSATFSLESPDGDQGFPGRLEATARYRVEGTAVRLDLAAHVDKPCPVNLSAHPYFNLAGAGAHDVNDHTLQVNATTFLPTDDKQIPTGAVERVDGTPFDFRTPVMIGSRVRDADAQLLVARGFDHCLVLDGEAGSLRPAARLEHAGSGRALDVETDRPGLQVYTGNSLNGSLVGHGGTYRMTAGLALEAQLFPDAPNQPGFPSSVLEPGQAFAATILYRFSTF